MTSEAMECCSSEQETQIDADECLLAKAVYKANILDDVAKSSAFFKSQQRGEEDLTFSEKRDIAETLLGKNSALFLQRYWKYINIRDISFFDDQCNDYEINYYLEEIRKVHDKKRNHAKIKNRRYEALKKMKIQGSYFSDEEMKNRKPFLYEQFIGQYMTEAEITAKRKDDNKNMSFSGFLIECMDRNFVNSLARKQEVEEEGDDTIENDDDTDDNEEEEEEIELDDDDDDISTKKPPTLPESEKQMLRSEFTNIMYESFLSGNDKDFDYSSVDNNAEYDSIQEREIDEEEKYFDEDSSERIVNET